MKIVNRRRMNDEGSHNIWRSYSDMMRGLLLLFFNSLRHISRNDAVHKF